MIDCLDSGNRKHGVCRYGLWRVHVEWDETTQIIHRLFFSDVGIESPVPVVITRFLAGKARSLSPYTSVALSKDYPYSAVYHAVSKIPYGERRTYLDIANESGVHPRTVGLAMKRNPTALIVPCHRVVSKTSLGGFTPSVSIKESLLKMEEQQSEKTNLNANESELDSNTEVYDADVIRG